MEKCWVELGNESEEKWMLLKINQMMESLKTKLFVWWPMVSGEEMLQEQHQGREGSIWTGTIIDLPTAGAKVSTESSLQLKLSPQSVIRTF